MRSLLDTNILADADSADKRAKRRRALELIQELQSAGTAVLSTQFLQEHTNVALRKLRLPSMLRAPRQTECML